MIPDDTNVSAFAAYSGKSKKTISRNQKRRLKSKEQKRLRESMDNSEEVFNKKKLKITSEDIGEKTLAKKKPKQHISTLAKVGIIYSGKDKSNKKLKKKKRINTIIDQPEAERKLKHSAKSDSHNKVEMIDYVSTNKSSNMKEVVNESELLLDGGNSKPKKLKRLKSKISENVSQQCSEELSNSDREPPKKIKKKVCITTPESNPESELKIKKPIICTPRFAKNKKVINGLGNRKQFLETNPGKTLQKVDEYLYEKKRIELKLSKIGDVGNSNKDQRSLKDIELAHLAKTEMQMKSSEVIGKYSLEKILEPVSVDSFIRDNWEKEPIHIPAKNPKKFSNLISTERIDAILRDRIVNFGKHLDVTSYTDGKRETHNLEGRANAHVVWDYYSNGCSVRLLNPQYFLQSVHSLNAFLQEYFGCFVGANSYLTPPMSQGFAPHYDDIEAFILQIEGSKIWRLYQPMKKNYLPRYSSRNLVDEEIGEPILEVKLKAGDVLYFPRGYIHQASTEEEHSLHLTLSVYQKTAWCDFLEKLLPLTLKKAANQDVEFRKGLPIGYLKSAGLVHKNASSRKELVRKIKKLITRLNDFLDTDEAMDQMGLSFIHDALPPALSVSEAACCVVGDGWKMRANGNLQGQVIITKDTKVRWLKAFCYRVLQEEIILENGTIEKQIRIYHTLENSKEYHAEEPQYLIVDSCMLPAITHLTNVYPKFTKVSQLPADDDDGKVLLVSDLWDRGLLMTDAPLEIYNSSKSDNEGKQLLTAEELEILSDLEEKIPKHKDNEGSSSGSDTDQTEESVDSESVESSDECSSYEESSDFIEEEDISDIDLLSPSSE